MEEMIQKIKAGVLLKFPYDNRQRSFVPLTLGKTQSGLVMHGIATDLPDIQYGWRFFYVNNIGLGKIYDEPIAGEKIQEMLKVVLKITPLKKTATEYTPPKFIQEVLARYNVVLPKCPKFTLLAESRDVDGHILHRIQYADGSYGGWLETEANLSLEGECQVLGEACVYDDARVTDNARVYGKALVKDNARVWHEARVFGSAIIGDNAEVYGCAQVSGHAVVLNDATVKDGEVMDSAMILDTASVRNRATVAGDALIFDDAQIEECATVKGSARIGGHTMIGGNITITGNVYVGGDADTHTDGEEIVCGDGRFFTGKELP